MANSFLEYYRFNTEIAPDRTVFIRTEKKSGESFQEYAQWWRELAAQVQPPMMEDEMIKWFIDNLKPLYYEKMINAQVTRFASLIPIRERIDEGIKTKKIVDTTILYSLMEQQLKGSDAKVEEGDVHMVAEDRGLQLAKSLPIWKAKGNSHLMGNLRNKPKMSHHFPISVTELYFFLLNEGLIPPVIPKPVTNLLEGYDPLKTCKFHYDALGHSIEECLILRHKIQSLIDSDALIFEGVT